MRLPRLIAGTSWAMPCSVLAQLRTFQGSRPQHDQRPPFRRPSRGAHVLLSFRSFRLDVDYLTGPPRCVSTAEPRFVSAARMKPQVSPQKKKFCDVRHTPGRRPSGTAGLEGKTAGQRHNRARSRTLGACAYVRPVSRAPAPRAVVRPVSGLARAPWARVPLRPSRAVVRPMSAPRRGEETRARASTTARARAHAVAMRCRSDPPHGDLEHIRLTRAGSPAYTRAQRP